ncbi:CsbD family protein [Ideonella sp. BN130291]|uniref:CsbD family protein n=1 Tax=Ideonella sp. BN130291 TaxID=3112940 RepID=UPI002E2566AB|nr:CsbD family protein [Ideonella sp. BN130291]
MNKDQVKGRAKKVEGELIDERGDATGDLSDDIKGKVEKGVGEVQKQYGDMKEKIRRDDDLNRR